MKILFDTQIFAKPLGGAARYFAELVRHLRDSRMIEVSLPWICLPNIYINQQANSARKALHRLLTRHAGIYSRAIALSATWNRNLTTRQLRAGRFDLFHPTYYDPYFLSHLSGKRFVLTIFDMIHEIYPEMYSESPIAGLKRRLAERAEHIIAISNHTKNDILRHYHIDDGKVSVIHLGCSLDPARPADTVRWKLPERYILYVGLRLRYKNFNRFLKALTPILRSDPNLHVICVGGGEFSDSEKVLMDELGIRGRILQYGATDGELTLLYQRALAFAFPSLYEGFGIPVLEAFACGCPVVLSNSSSLTEVASDAAVFFDPLDENSIRTVIQSVIYNNDVRAEYRARGLARVKHFSWEETARKTRELYCRLA